ncbi:uncharacterized protein LOC143518187 [Brachyhypopomus gauderio]|uniref:uncharacterized protein LOC143518187 n=1 Tax=Brachyhypopomus gauderio TaxID=698409 RepID=UPI0040423E5E
MVKEFAKKFPYTKGEHASKGLGTTEIANMEGANLSQWQRNIDFRISSNFQEQRKDLNKRLEKEVIAIHQEMELKIRAMRDEWTMREKIMKDIFYGLLLMEREKRQQAVKILCHLNTFVEGEQEKLHREKILEDIMGLSRRARQTHTAHHTAVLSNSMPQQTTNITQNTLRRQKDKLVENRWAKQSQWKGKVLEEMERLRAENEHLREAAVQDVRLRVQQCLRRERESEERVRLERRKAKQSKEMVQEQEKHREEEERKRKDRERQAEQLRIEQETQKLQDEREREKLEKKKEQKREEERRRQEEEKREEERKRQEEEKREERRRHEEEKREEERRRQEEEKSQCNATIPLSGITAAPSKRELMQEMNDGVDENDVEATSQSEVDNTDLDTPWDTETEEEERVRLEKRKAKQRKERLREREKLRKEEERKRKDRERQAEQFRSEQERQKQKDERKREKLRQKEKRGVIEEFDDSDTAGHIMTTGRTESRGHQNNTRKTEDKLKAEVAELDRNLRRRSKHEARKPQTVTGCFATFMRKAYRKVTKNST